MALIDAVYWLIEDAVAKRIGNNCPSPECSSIFASLSDVRMELYAVVTKRSE